jgi:AcrR family transcriptional regulator
MTTRLSGLQRRDQIVECARYVFAQQGYEGARTAEIADRAGVSERLLYKHFETKASLFETVARDTARRVAAGYAAAAERATDVQSALDELYFGRLGPGSFRGRTEGQFFERSHGPYDDPELDKAMSDAYRRLATAATQFFQALVDRGLVNKAVDAELKAWEWSGVLRQHDFLHTAYPVRRAAALERKLVADFVQSLGPTRRR